MEWFAQIVGSVDLRQHYPPQDDVALPEVELDPDPQYVGQIAPLLDVLKDVVPKISPQEQARRDAVRAADALPHPHAEDPVLARLGDWDPLVVEINYLSHIAANEEIEMAPTNEGGIAHHFEFAPSFEHKANVSGAVNPTILLPNGRRDPIVFAKGIRLPFMTYLRRYFSRGGFFGVPRLVHQGSSTLKTVEAGFSLPDRPIFVSLAKDMEPF